MKRCLWVVVSMIGILCGTRYLAAADSPSKPVQWEPVGMSGCGGMYGPAYSGVDPKLMMVNCDMSGAYLSHDGGANWRMIHQSQLRASTRCRPAFHPTDVKVIFAAQYGAGLKVSRDGGEHWEAVKVGPLGRDGRVELVGDIGIDPGRPDRMMVGDAKQQCITDDGGKTWQVCQGPSGETISFHFDQTSPADNRVCFIATADGVWRSDDGGKTWAEKTKGLPWKPIRSFAGGSNAKDKTAILYCTIPSKEVDAKYAGGVFRSTDRGETWESAMGAGLNMDTKAADEWAMAGVCQYSWVLTTDVKPATVYALNWNTGVLVPHNTAFYRSDDAGKTWRPTFFQDPRFKQYNCEPDYMTVMEKQGYQGPDRAAICPTDPERVLDLRGYLFYSTNGGKDWKCGHTRRVKDSPDGQPQWECNGLVVTTTWNYYFDPFEPRRHYICYTDIGLARSLDGGKSWVWWGANQAKWRNTCYEMAFDPKTPGKIWGAFSNTHDIPNSNIIGNYHKDSYPGGVCISTDFGKTWEVSNKGLPESACVSVVVDPKSPAGNRALYASMFNNGVYKSTDDGKTWSKASEGLGDPKNMRTCRIVLHEDGTLFVVITARRQKEQPRDFLPEGVGVYRSTDGAKTWECINKSQPLLWPKDITVDPKDSKIIYVGACNTTKANQAGLYRTTDGGATWKKLATEGPQHFGAYLHPRKSGWIYMTLTEGSPAAGLWLSKDNGATFKPMNGLPFVNAQRVAFDPKDDSIIYVTTFGGSVWKGPAEE
ncbi:MAG: WD40/YVTN/BNR-like repeat-containing protein [Phycisphaerae bacterium]